MRRLLMALAAIPLLACTAKADPNWGGVYGGVHVGAAFSDASTSDTNGGVKPGPFDYSGSGLVAGGTAGYNILWGHALVGVEGDIGYMDLDAHGIIPSSVPTKHQDLTIEDGLYGDIAARLGYLVMPGTLIYGKAGLAFFNGDASQKTTNPGYVTNPTNTFTGYVVGGGVEHFVTDNISMKLEYAHFDFGHRTGDQTSITDPPVGYVYKNDTSLDADSVTAAIVYHF